MKQTYSGETLYSTKTPGFEHFAPLSDKDPSELLEEIALPREWQIELRDYAASRGIDFFSTPFDAVAVAELDALGVPALKIASFEIVDPELIAAAARTGRPLLISTGMATLGEIEAALKDAIAAGAKAVGLMQCTSVYPAPAERRTCGRWRRWKPRLAYHGSLRSHHRDRRADRGRGTGSGLR